MSKSEKREPGWPSSAPAGWRVVRERQRAQIMGTSRATQWRMEQEGTAPRRVKLGARAVGWFLHELEAWARERGEGR